MKFSLKSVLFGSAALGILATSFSALAIPHRPNAYEEGNIWWLTAYDDNSNNHQWREHRAICFGPVVPLSSPNYTHTKYKDWLDVWSSSFPLFAEAEKGKIGAHQEGDQIFMVGDNYCGATGIGCRIDWHDSRQWEITSLMRGYGHLQRWHETSGEHAWYNIKLERLWLRCDCHGLASYLSSVDIDIDNVDTLERLLLTRPECEPTDTVTPRMSK